MKKLYSHLILILQCILSVFFGSLIFHVLALNISAGTFFTNEKIVTAFIPYLVALVFSLFPQVFLKIKHRSKSPEGLLLPLLFLMITLECSAVFPEYYLETGTLLLPPTAANIIVRFSFLGCALIFICTSISYTGEGMNHMGTYVGVGFLTILLISLMAPNSSNIRNVGNHFGSEYDVYLNYAIILMNLCAIVTYIVGAINDKMSHNVRRAICFILMLIANFGIFHTPSLVLSIISDVLFIAASILLVVSSKDYF